MFLNEDNCLSTRQRLQTHISEITKQLSDTRKKYLFNKEDIFLRNFLSVWKIVDA